MTQYAIVFPAHAGMSPSPPEIADNLRSFPRTRGDEPTAQPLADASPPFSPHTRG